MKAFAECQFHGPDAFSVPPRTTPCYRVR
jgi:hypothetical protein